MLRRPITPKPAKCAHCKTRLERVGQRIHEACVGPWYEANREKRRAKAVRAEKRQDAAKRKALKTIPDLIKEAQHAFNAYIRERDKDKPCICCGMPLGGGSGSTGGEFDCGHYRSVGSASQLRFHESNAHGQRKFCNRYGAGRAVDYRIGLISRIGLDAVEALESSNAPHKWTHDELRAIRDDYRARVKELKAKHA